MSKSYSKIRHIQEANEILDRRFLNEVKTSTTLLGEQVTGDTTTTPPIAKPTQSYQQPLVDKNLVSNDSGQYTLPTTPISATVTKKGPGMYQLNINSLSNTPIMVNKGVITPPLSKFQWVQSLTGMTFGTATRKEQNELSTAITKAVNKVVMSLPKV
jgi:hypothetical protein